MNEILEYIDYNRKANLFAVDTIIENLKTAIDNFDENTPQEVKIPVIKALGITCGWLEYKVKDFADETGLSKTAVKTQIKQLLEDEIITLYKIENITFILLNKSI